MSEPFEESRPEENSSAAGGKTVEGPAINFDAEEASEVMDNEGRTCIEAMTHLSCFNPQPSYRQGVHDSQQYFDQILREAWLSLGILKCDLLPSIPDCTFIFISESE